MIRGRKANVSLNVQGCAMGLVTIVTNKTYKGCSQKLAGFKRMLP